MTFVLPLLVGVSLRPYMYARNALYIWTHISPTSSSEPFGLFNDKYVGRALALTTLPNFETVHPDRVAGDTLLRGSENPTTFAVAGATIDQPL